MKPEIHKSSYYEKKTEQGHEHICLSEIVLFSSTCGDYLNLSEYVGERIKQGKCLPEIKTGWVFRISDHNRHTPWTVRETEKEALETLVEQFGSTDSDWETETTRRIYEIEAEEEYGAAWVAYSGNTKTNNASIDGFVDEYFGEWESEEAFAKTIFLKRHKKNVPDILKYIDYGLFANDLFSHDYCSLENPSGGVFVFLF